ncbi:MAG: patatin family protein [Eubacteriales bacterium]|nr:patatin family protein [Eubacteriales bacterium]
MLNAGLVLEGGGMRGIFTGGVLDYIMEQELQFGYVAGVSAGACNAMDYLSMQIGRTRDSIAIEDPNYRYIHPDPYHMLRGKGFDMEMLCGVLPWEYKPFDFETYFQSETVCDLVATNVLTGEAEYLDERQDEKRLMKICEASCSLPIINQMVELDGKLYVDGGVADSVPLKRALDQGYRKIVLVLTRNKGYRKKEESIANRLYKRKYKQYPELVKALVTRNARYNRLMDQIDALEEEGRIFVIRPEGEVVSRIESDNEALLAFYEQGYRVMQNHYTEMLAYLAK